MPEAPDWANDPETQVLSENRDGVLLLTLNRPDRLNAWNPVMAERLFGLMSAADDDPGVRVVVVTGAGRGFCAGADMEALSMVEGAAGSGFEHGERPLSFPTTLRKPVIAAINGPAAGVGLVVALFADLRFAAEDAKLTTAFSRLGLVAEYGIAWHLPRLVGAARALDLLLSSRIVLGDEAERIGLVNRALPRDQVLDAALDHARILAEGSSPASMAWIKAQVYRGMDSDLTAACEEAAALMPEAFAGADFSEGLAAHLAKRTPDFAGLPPRERG
ncbi:enoyl-CoA hydratase/carnithine racemase [Spinactinospora alkalitolerans]|uniref:Enoyl-CoA hydratase/carnithine racemase n=1 Tax=Spinactinospora alkalitolerans TaxID=687207 RepID=A0A852TYB2_9ACTN|nr:enoyl-CoA hydratase-related protein [Spinactinospora alkalitolerans]NYE49536.1 enoyl-CoA hydratase/carnithine racemase [Spinactinospora alkalitolerans]